jgi:hypothetical protein
MKLDYLKNINEFGDNIIRLYDFEHQQAQQFLLAIQTVILKENKPLDISTLDFIENVNCSLILRITEQDDGISVTNKQQFFCDLTLKSYEDMTNLISPFCKLKSLNRHNWLYDIDTKTDFLFSPMGTW